MRLQRTNNREKTDFWYKDLDNSKQGLVLGHARLYKRDYVTNYVTPKPMYGVDICIEFIDNEDSFEVLHLEWDGSSLYNFEFLRDWVENLIDTTDFNSKVQEIKEQKHEWDSDWTKRSEWTRKFWNIPKRNGITTFQREL